jgi:UDP-glucose 4-epimerase
MKILVTGATGRVGSVLTRALIDRGERVRALVMEGDPYRARLAGMDVDVITGDLISGEGMAEGCAGVDAVIHLGALMAWTQADWPRLFEINLRGTFNLLQAVAEGSPDVKRVVLASTDASYPAAAPLYAPVDEHHPQVPDTFYGMTKQVGEAMGQFYARKLGLPVARARFCYTLAPEEIVDPSNPHCANLFFLSARLRSLRGRDPSAPGVRESLAILQDLEPTDGSERIMIPYGEDGTSWVYTLCHVRDLVSGILLLLDRDEAVGDVFNLGPAAPFALDVAFKYMSGVTGIPYVEARLPGPAKVYTVNVAKARAVLGYAPQYDIFAFIDEASSSDKAAGSVGK